MKYLFYLSGENLELGLEEIKAFGEIKEINNRAIIAECDKFDFRRLAFTKKVVKLYLECNEKELFSKLKDTDFKIKGSYCVRTININEKKAAESVWESMDNPKVNLENPEMIVQVICENKKCYSGILEYDNVEKFSERRPHLRPGFHPSSMQPKLARALVNLSRVKKDGTLLDPFCGTGGIMIEAGLIGIKNIGLDLNEEMIALADRNLKEYKIKNYKLIKGDATKKLIKCDAIVTDLPYGKSSSLLGANQKKLYESFIKNAFASLAKGKYLVMMIPKTINVNIFKFNKEAEILHYVNKSLTRKILVLRKN